MFLLRFVSSHWYVAGLLAASEPILIDQAVAIVQYKCVALTYFSSCFLLASLADMCRNNNVSRNFVPLCFHPINLESISRLCNFTRRIILRRDKVILMLAPHEKFLAHQTCFSFISHFGFWQVENALKIHASLACKASQQRPRLSPIRWISQWKMFSFEQKVSNFKRSWNRRPARNSRGNIALSFSHVSREIQNQPRWWGKILAAWMQVWITWLIICAVPARVCKISKEQQSNFAVELSSKAIALSFTLISLTFATEKMF